MKLYSFPNLGNTCYLNSVLQCFVNDPDFKNSLESCQEELKVLLDKIDVDFTANEEYINHKFNLINVVNHFSNKFKRFQQHDAHEFLLEFLEQTGINVYGQTKTNLICRTCRTVSSTLEKFSTIDLNCEKTNLVETFMDYLNPETIHDYHCEKCKKVTVADKKCYLWQLNKILIIVLKKYHSKQRLVYPFNDLKIRETCSGKVVNYSLYAILNHHGTSQMGHYNCNVKVNNNWYFIDDQNIFLNNNKINDNDNTYILFYKIAS